MHAETVIIGGGQAGLATGYHLMRRGYPFVIFQADDRVGDVWRKRYDSLRLYSAARYSGLPGWPFPADPWTFPTGHEMGDYLEEYAKKFELPVRTSTHVDRLERDGEAYVITAKDQRFAADNVVVATGTFQKPIVPEFAAELAPSIRQLHSGEYRNPSQLQDGPVLVVGAAHSGADIAYEVVREHRTILSGRDPGQIPVPHGSRRFRLAVPVLWFVWHHVLTERTPMGRKLQPEIRAHGGPLVRPRRADLLGAGVERTEARVVGVRDGKPVLSDGQILDVTNVIWCTGFGKDLSWIQIPVAGPDGWPETTRGVVTSSPGLYFVGLPFLYAFSSMLIGGVGRDAEYVANHIVRRAASDGLPQARKFDAIDQPAA